MLQSCTLARQKRCDEPRALSRVSRLAIRRNHMWEHRVESHSQRHCTQNYHNTTAKREYEKLQTTSLIDLQLRSVQGPLLLML